MRKRRTAIQRATGNTDLDITLQGILDDVEDGLLVIDSEYQVKLANSAVRDRYQKEAKSPIGRLCYEVFHDRDRPCGAPLWDCPLRKVLESGSMTTVIHPVHILGADTYLKVTMYPLRDSYGNTKAVIEMRRDVTAERELESQLHWCLESKACWKKWLGR